MRAGSVFVFALALAGACVGGEGTRADTGQPEEASTGAAPDPSTEDEEPGSGSDSSLEDDGDCSTTEGSGDGDSRGDGQVDALVAVGYGGMRVVSRDGGSSWGDYSAWGLDGDDDLDLLRAVTWGDGLWVASGWKWATSKDGVNWTDHGMVGEDLLGINCNIIEGLAYADGYFYAACPQWESPGAIYRSEDGMNFEFLAEIGQTGGHLYLEYREGLFVAYGDTQTSFSSTDALNWAEMPGLTDATFCEGEWRSFEACHEAQWFDGHYFRGLWSRQIQRSGDGDTWTVVWEDEHGDNVPYRPRAIAKGRVDPG